MSEPPSLSFWSVAEADPDRVALIDARGAETTYGELLRRVNRLSHGLRARGLGRGDAVAAAVPNIPAFLELYLAAMQSGLYFVPVNRHLQPEETAHVIADCEAGAFVTEERLWDGRVAAALDAVPAATYVVGDVPGLPRYEDLSAGQPDDALERIAGQVMMYTSGTTGRPKGVRRPLPEGDPAELAALTASVTCAGFGIEPGPGVHLVCGPLYHAGPFLGAMITINYGYTVVLMESFDAEQALANIERHRVSSTQMVPTMFQRLLALPDDVKQRYDVGSLRSVLHTGAPCPVPVKQQMMDWWGPVLYETYGGTEAAATIAKPHRWLERPGTVGRPVHGVTVAIVDDEGKECPPGVPGTIYISSAFHQPAEYFKDPDKTRSIRRGDAVTLGDVGYLDEDGWLFLCDRKIDMIISGGVNIYPAEVEAVLVTHPAVLDAAVVGIPDDEWGEQVKAVVETVRGTRADDALATELISWCRSRIAHFKCPRSVDFVEALPRLPNGKLRKRDLRERYWADQDARI